MSNINIDQNDLASLMQFANDKQVDQIKQYIALLIEFNQKKNLISRSSVPNIWKRHILDCIQIDKFILHNAELIYDIGSGAGLPGILISILRKNSKISLIEKSAVKANFLLEVKNKLLLDNVSIVNYSVDSRLILDIINQDQLNSHNKGQITFITRAFKDTKSIIELLSKVAMRYKIQIIALKGQSMQGEMEYLDYLSQSGDYRYFIRNSITNEGFVLELHNKALLNTWNAT